MILTRKIIQNIKEGGGIMKNALNWGEIIKWAEIIVQIILLISGGMPRNVAVNYVAKKYGISAIKIWKHGGF
jgi:hypothetical protein